MRSEVLLCPAAWRVGGHSGTTPPAEALTLESSLGGGGRGDLSARHTRRQQLAQLLADEQLLLLRWLRLEDTREGGEGAGEAEDRTEGRVGGQREAGADEGDEEGHALQDEHVCDRRSILLHLRRIRRRGGGALRGGGPLSLSTPPSASPRTPSPSAAPSSLSASRPVRWRCWAASHSALSIGSSLSPSTAGGRQVSTHRRQTTAAEGGEWVPGHR